MKKIFDAVKNNPLFLGIDSDGFEKFLTCAEGAVKKYKKDEIVFLAGGEINSVGLVLSGGVKITREDSRGNALILTELSAGEVFGEVFACADVKNIPVSVTAYEKSEILFINYKKIITACSSACLFHSKLIENMLRLIAKKNLMLNSKIEILSKRTIRERLMFFLEQSGGGKKKFTIPFNREELARSLAVDRSALSNELSKMQKEGVLRFEKNRFEILD